MNGEVGITATSVARMARLYQLIPAVWENRSVLYGNLKSSQVGCQHLCDGCDEECGTWGNVALLKLVAVAVFFCDFR